MFRCGGIEINEVWSSDIDLGYHYSLERYHILHCYYRRA